jgi:hypothetical protein
VSPSSGAVPPLHFGLPSFGSVRLQYYVDVNLS